ncbi:hypothetical protein C8035_v008627 [Colletotrichum spinosum]|uniref:Cyanovirin-N domain-containing protein n=1 Tax=Colletotrichum spinosum TaxID=1347390 RepID=A0A4R8PQF5_9PEZI|nr:hypothetical protein C8035_v008627 [Colletotrichum spinosum]
MQPSTFVLSAFLAATATAKIVPGCHFWVREIATGNNVLQRCLGKGWSEFPFLGGSRVEVKADQNCGLTVDHAAYAAHFDAPCDVRFLFACCHRSYADVACRSTMLASKALCWNLTSHLVESHSRVTAFDRFDLGLK